ncbi:MAG: hypothetical protein GWN13_12785, partial [Phycisphaerae bacterium]|nr:hypothetical protein [Phycisphaerae bacterium]
MTKYKTEDTVYRTVTVPAPVERAFAVFTDEFASWWPTENSFSEEEMETA